MEIGKMHIRKKDGKVLILNDGEVKQYDRAIFHLVVRNHVREVQNRYWRQRMAQRGRLVIMVDPAMDEPQWYTWSTIDDPTKFEAEGEVYEP